MRRILLFLSLLFLFSCSAQEQGDDISSASEIAPVERTFFGSDVRDKNLGTDFVLPATTGKLIALHDTQGKITVLVFGYAHCPDVCPTNLLTYADALKMLGEQEKNVQLYFITVDPERDTLDAMKSYVTIFNKSFIGLVADNDKTLQEVKDAWQIVAQKVPREDGNYLVDHSAGTYILDKDGRTVLYEPHGMSAQQLADDIELLLK